MPHFLHSLNRVPSTTNDGGELHELYTALENCLLIFPKEGKRAIEVHTLNH